MFELSVAIKYLTPRWRQLSVSIISLISILVIALVVWLVVVFFSVTNGLTNSWIDKMIALTAPVRITPTEDYYKSYYHQIDSISANSNYESKSLREKLAYNGMSDPYDPFEDEEIPAEWSAPDTDGDGNLKDLVKIAFAAVKELDPQFQQPTAAIFEIGSAQLRLFLEKNGRSVIEQTVFLGSYDPQNTLLNNSVIPITQAGIANLHRSVYRSNDDSLATDFLLKSKEFSAATALESAKLTNEQLFLPNSLFESPTKFRAIGLYRDAILTKILVPFNTDAKALVEKHSNGFTTQAGVLTLSKNVNFFPEDQPIDPRTPAYLLHDQNFPVNVVNGEIEIALNVQGTPLLRHVPLTAISPTKYSASKAETSLWFENTLPTPNHFGNPVLLPKSYRDGGVAVGDLGTLGYSFPTASAIQELRTPIYVAGFYDPGIIPSGGKFVIGSEELVSEIRGAHSQNEFHTPSTTGINIRLADREQADAFKAALQKKFEAKGISRYWKIETYKDYEFSRDLIKQLGSEKRLFSLLAAIIIIVACSNIISMLIILVNDKKKEIGILRSMGASSISIMTIFGTCGIVMGVMGSLIGTLAALLTLQHLQGLINLISWVQGYEMFNPLFYGDTLPSKISVEAFMFVVGVTGVISLLAGIIPAVKACLLKPSATLRSE